MPKNLREFVFAATVAELTGFANGPAFLRQRAVLEDEHDFPLPVPAARPLRWRRSEVRVWVDRLGVSRTELHTRQPLPISASLVAEAGRA